MRSLYIVLWINCIFLVKPGNAQGLQHFPVEFINNISLPNAYAGGLISPQFSEMDVNQDGKKDLIVYEKSSSIFIPFINKGTNGTTEYRFDHSYSKMFPRISTWAILKDFNRDGIEDIFSGNTSDYGIEVWESKIDAGEIKFVKLLFNNASTSNITYQLSDSLIQSIQLPLGSFPELIDVDGDSDLDILAIGQNEQYVTYYKNLQVEKGLTNNTLDFVLFDECFGKFEIDVKTSEVILSDNPDICKQTLITSYDNQSTKIVHNGSSIMAFDQNCDDLIDLLLGDGKENTIKLVVNGGTVENAYMTSVQPLYPNEPVDISYFVSTYYIDVNNDGAKDLIAVHNDLRDGQTEENIWLYINNGETCNPNFRLATKSWLVNEMIQFTSSSKPALCDFNNDGLVDIVIGGHIVKRDQAFENRLVLFENIGSRDNPRYSLNSTNYLDFSNTTINYSGRLAPSFGDLDSDGDLDLLVGDGYGSLFYVENVAGKDKPFNFKTPISNFKDIFVGPNAVPCIHDLDGDSLQDIVISNWRHNIIFFKNIGSVGKPEFNGDQSLSPNLIDVGLVFEDKTSDADLNGSIFFFESYGDVKMALGTKDGSIRIYNDIQGPLSRFKLAENFSDQIYFGRNVNPILGDINDDNYHELILGNNSGGLKIYKTEYKVKNEISTVKYSQDKSWVYPNPIFDFLTIESFDTCEIEIYDSKGRFVLAQNIPSRSGGTQIDLSTLSQGVYFVKLKNSKNITTKRILKL